VLLGCWCRISPVSLPGHLGLWIFLLVLFPLYSIIWVWCVIIFFSFSFFFFFLDRAALYSPGSPGTHSVHHAGLELSNLPASASWVLELKAYAITAPPEFVFSIAGFKDSFISLF
jgi:hypothetical protein